MEAAKTRRDVPFFSPLGVVLTNGASVSSFLTAFTFFSAEGAAFADFAASFASFSRRLASFFAGSGYEREDVGGGEAIRSVPALFEFGSRTLFGSTMSAMV